MDRLTSPSARLFFGFWPDPAAAAAIAGWRDRCDLGETARPTAVGDLHVTLHFVGALQRDAIAGLVAATAQAPFQSTRVGLGRADLWPGGIALLHVTVPDAVQSLHAALGAAIRSLGLPIEARPWQPHLTLARRATREPALPAPRVEWTVSRFALVESAQGRYRVVAWFPGAGTRIRR
jgi:2'-5' RNA ligase